MHNNAHMWGFGWGFFAFNLSCVPRESTKGSIWSHYFGKKSKSVWGQEALCQKEYKGNKIGQVLIILKLR